MAKFEQLCYNVNKKKPPAANRRRATGKRLALCFFHGYFTRKPLRLGRLLGGYFFLLLTARIIRRISSS
jgi:hypothetical protein